jgi:hypothetical protein
MCNYTAEDYATVNKTGTTVTAGAASTGTRVPDICSWPVLFYKISEHDAKWNYGKCFNNAMRETGQNNNFSNKLVQLKTN